MRESQRRSGPGGERGGADKKDGQRRTLFRRRKVCKFCAEKLEYIDYKDAKQVQQFILERAKILPRRISGTCARHQRPPTHLDGSPAPLHADLPGRPVGASNPRHDRPHADLIETLVFLQRQVE